MLIVKKGTKYYFGHDKNGANMWGNRKALAKKYADTDEIKKDFPTTYNAIKKIEV